jgi:hypothetical protein
MWLAVVDAAVPLCRPMGAIEALIPKAGKANDDGLRAADANVIARYVSDARNPWWRRRPCALALRGRVPEAHVAALLERVRDAADTAEVRIALLDVLEGRAELLPWLQAQGAGEGPLPEACLKARAGLGDLTAVPALATLANDLWFHRRTLGEAALDTLVARHGHAAVASQLGDVRPEDRAFHVRMSSHAGGDVTAAFTDPDVGVARDACERVIATGIPDDETLVDRVITGPTIESRLWAAYALHRRGRAIRELWHAIGSPRVEIAGLDDDLRLAILREYEGQRRTDPRWLVERACVDLPAPDEQEQLADAVAALAEAGLEPGTPQPIGVVNQQGAGTYHVIQLGGASSIQVSTLGPYVTSDDPNVTARRALEAVGFRWIDAALGAIRVDGLCVYYFGNRDPLDVHTLLFYWQD